jgi:hypothetical protein
MPTFVPQQLMREGFSSATPMSVANWTAERDIFTWLRPRQQSYDGYCGSFEYVLELFEKWLLPKPNRKPGFLSALRRGYLEVCGSRCHHDVPCYRTCDRCVAWRHESIRCLKELWAKVAAFVYSEGYWIDLTARDFELECGRLFEALGYQVRVTPSSNDRGIDIVLSRSSRVTFVQCKRYAGKAGPNFVRELVGAVTADLADGGILICTGGFTSGAVELASSNRIELWGVGELVKLAFSVSLNGKPRR